MSEPVPEPAQAPMNRSRRIDVVDALRGFALMGILLLHNVEKYNFSAQPDMPVDFLRSWDAHVWSTLFLLFGGKSYAIFSMLFGFSFWVQYSRMRDKGYDMGRRFVWRLSILFGFGLLHSTYYSGDLLIFYSSFGLLLVVLRKASDKWCFILSIVLLFLPRDLYHLVAALLDPGHITPQDNASWPYWGSLAIAQAGDSFLALSRAYLTDGLKANIIWTWEAGRMFHIPGLFLLGMLAARRNAFTQMSSRNWAAIAAVSLILFLPLHIMLSDIWSMFEGRESLTMAMYSFFSPMSDLCLTLFIVAVFILLWRARIGERLFSVLIPYGRMSLTNYVTQGLTGVILYNGCCLGLFHYFGHTMSLLTGFGVLAVQVAFSHWCLRRFGQGPLEKLWRKLMWLGYDKTKTRV